MPIAYILVAMALLLGGWYRMDTVDKKEAITAQNEARVIAMNMVAFKDWLREVALVRDENGRLPYYHLFFGNENESGDSASLHYYEIKDMIAASGKKPKNMAWFDGPLDGVSAYVKHGKIVVYFNRTNRWDQALKGDVQKELLKLTGGSYNVGKATGYPR